MSILDSIQAAEAKAEQAKIDAANKVEALMEQTKKNAEIKGNDLLKEAQVVEQKIAKETAIKLAANEKELIARYEKEDRDVASLADSRIDIAISYIMKKVVSSW